MTAKQETRTEAGMLRLQYVRSCIGTTPKHKMVIKSLGFKRLSQVVERVDTPAVRGMVAQVPHLVKILDPGKA
jgi:large subunit ribosomal protein L30